MQFKLIKENITLLNEGIHNMSSYNPPKDDTNTEAFKLIIDWAKEYHLGTLNDYVVYILPDGSIITPGDSALHKHLQNACALDIRRATSGVPYSGILKFTPEQAQLIIDTYPYQLDEYKYKSGFGLLEDGGAIRCNGGPEQYIVLPDIRVTTKQYQVLEDWLGTWMNVKGPKMELADHNNNYFIYDTSNMWPDDLTKQIKLYYSFGKFMPLREKLNVSKLLTLNESMDEVDSEGNPLTLEQIAFFKNSKVRNTQGQLLVCYHGTKKQFTKFDPLLTDTGNNQYGSGFYFTTNSDTAQLYTDSQNPNVIKAYINIKKPLVLDSIDGNNLNNIDITPAQAYKIIKLAPNIMHKEESPLGDFVDEYWEYGPKDYMLRQVANDYNWDLMTIEDFFKDNPTKYREALNKVLGYDGVIINFKNSQHIIAWFPEQIKYLTNKQPTKSQDMNEDISTETDSDGNVLSTEQLKFFASSKVRDDNNKLMPCYHGTRRADRVGNQFRADRATSGPMAFFTTDKSVGTRYSQDKADTSISYDDEYDGYENQFRVPYKGSTIGIVDYWNTLSTTTKNEIKQKAKHITFDDDYNIIYDETQQYGVGNFRPNEIIRYKGNILEVLVYNWLYDANLYHREKDFIKVLKLLGIKNVVYMDPDVIDEKVYSVYLNIKNPFVTDTVGNAFKDAILALGKNYKHKPGNSADLWDKRNITPQNFADRLSSDILRGTTHAWTSIPDFVTEYLKSKGHDGIKDTGGKYSGIDHIVWIPFYSEQIKETTNAKPTQSKNINENVLFEKATDIEIHDESVGGGYGQIDYEMTAKINGELAGYLSYSVADDTPYINMIQTESKFKRQGVATALLQTLQKKYSNITIHFGYSTEDGGKLLKATTHEVPNPNYRPWHAKRVNKLLVDINKLEKEQKANENIMRELWAKSKNNTITDSEQIQYEDVMEKDIELKDEINRLNYKVFQITKDLSDDALSPTNRMINLD